MIVKIIGGDTLKIAICDDDQIIINQLEQYLTSFFSQKGQLDIQFNYYFSGEALLETESIPDIIFLDIELPGLNGVYVGNILKQRNPSSLIFVVTAYSDYLDDAMRFHVFRYLSKPIDVQRLYQNLEDALEHLYTFNRKIAIQTKNSIHTIYTSDLIFIEAKEKKVYVHTTTTEYISIQPLKQLLLLLPEALFIQTHKSFIINFQYVTKFDRSSIQLANGEFYAYLTRRKYKTFRNAYLLYLESTR